MDYTLIIGYFVLLLIQYFAIQAIPITIVGGLISRITGIYPAIIITGLLTWLGINLIWLKVFDFNLTLLAFVLSIGLQLFHLKTAKTDLTGTSKQMIIGEIISLIIVGIYILAFKEFNFY
ncbi:hypothetical protein [Maribacter dokdonensis]|uniref:hypothetical protein n=1 Tax=Maribacter dokdonensis TaxID=320912 RepID=UPI0027362212|nr:hypothetical protein [Maribacter dokdonensis]MDP2524868.1 hypothetical protein [Maribacter dokdonensis]